MGDDTRKGWIVYSNANGVCYEHILRYTSNLGQMFDKNIIVYNYRGVADSKGSCNNTFDMVEDLINVIEYVEKREDDPEAEIILWGHSIGGAVTIYAARSLGSSVPNLNLVVDRSFDSLAAVIYDKVSTGPLGPIICGLLSSSLCFICTMASFATFDSHPWPTITDPSGYVQFLDYGRAILAGSCVVWVSVRLGRESTNLPFFLGFFAQIFFGNLWLGPWAGLDSFPAVLLFVFTSAFELGIRGYFSRFLVRLVVSQGWSLETKKVIKDVKAKHIVITYHADDEMIPLSASLKNVALNEKDVIQLDGSRDYSAPNHMYDLSQRELRKIHKILAE